MKLRHTALQFALFIAFVALLPLQCAANDWEDACVDPDRCLRLAYRKLINELISCEKDSLPSVKASIVDNVLVVEEEQVGYSVYTTVPLDRLKPWLGKRHLTVVCLDDDLCIDVEIDGNRSPKSKIDILWCNLDGSSRPRMVQSLGAILLSLDRKRQSSAKQPDSQAEPDCSLAITPSCLQNAYSSLENRLQGCEKMPIVTSFSASVSEQGVRVEAAYSIHTLEEVSFRFDDLQAAVGAENLSISCLNGAPCITRTFGGQTMKLNSFDMKWCNLYGEDHEHLLKAIRMILRSHSGHDA